MENPTIVAAIAGLIGGVILSYLKSIFDRQIQSERFQLELENARRLKLVEAQSGLLDDLGTACWKWRYAAMPVVYYGSRGEEPAYQEAVKNYKEHCWLHLSEIRTLGTRAARIICATAPGEIDSFYKKIDAIGFVIDDTIATPKDPQQRKALLGTIVERIQDEVREDIGKLMKDLAHRAHLTPAH